MTDEQTEELSKLLEKPKHIVIVPHKNPDGDAMGSCLALYHFLRPNHNCHVIAPNDYPDFLKWLPGTKDVIIYENRQEEAKALIYKADIIFTLDFNALDRIGGMETPVSESTADKVMIDHHQQPEDYASITYSEIGISSTCEMVYNAIEAMNKKDKINSEIATCLYTGMMTDTGSFRFPSTTSQTHRIVADLIDKGANHSDIHNRVYDTNSYHKLQLLGRALTNLKVLEEYKTAYITLTQEELNLFNFKKGDTEGFVNYGLSLEGIVFAVIFIENSQENIIKISLRSKGDFSVNDFARNHFGGGGHINAAGGKSDLSLKDTVAKFISILPSYKNALNNEK
ncbi:DHH family phosphoesterase [Aegicerativicinus sediminis]|uniref:DHH family phosphoesterase n=1 Tax=Aegicerativicinus sediminis TaxID=2893202 RepID=UPI001E5FC3D3|nr:bifunctional oligoribonuclease/PAP phosphatase NrnA [Aegicerativicinus sediminis]